MRTQADYWNKKISEWSLASYGKSSNIGIIEKIATYFRSVDKRKDAAIKLIGKDTKGKTILDLGCGLCEFTFDVLKHKPKKVIALDISPVAIKEAKKNAKKLKVNGKIEFKVEDVSKLNKLPNADIIVGLGFIDYLDTNQLKKFFKLVGNKPYLFSFFEKKLSFFNLLHKIYITIQGCPGAFKYSRKEIKKIVPAKSKLYFVNQNGLLFISNIRLKDH